MSEAGNINSIYSYFKTKYTHYVPDGWGRDKYIIQNNGGLCNEPKRVSTSSSMYAKALPSKMRPAPQKAASSFKYVSDGSGRDFYVTFNSGGLEAPYVPGQRHPSAAFFTSLRNNRPIVKYRRHISPKQYEDIKRSRSTQKVLVQRLTANSEKWREMTRQHRTAIGRRHTSSTRKKNDTLDYDDHDKLLGSADSANLTLNHKFKSNRSIASNEYDDMKK